MVDEADASNALHTHHKSVTSREKWNFFAILGTTSEQREDKDQYKKFSKKLKQYILREFKRYHMLMKE